MGAEIRKDIKARNKMQRTNLVAGGRLLLVISCILFSEASWEPGLADPERTVLEDFSQGRIGEFPPEWNWHEKNGKKIKYYTIQEEGNRRYLNAKADGVSVMITKKVSWNLREYPILTWRWRVKALPLEGDERIREKNDSAAAIYVAFSRNWLRIPKSIKYVWSATTPVGTLISRKATERPPILVLESGKAQLGEWVTERVNLYEDYKRAYGGEPPEKTVGIALVTDSDITHSFAEADYGDIQAVRQK